MSGVFGWRSGNAVVGAGKAGEFCGIDDDGFGIGSAVEPGVDDGLAGFYIDVKYGSIIKRDWIFECAGVADQRDLLILHRFGNVRWEQRVEVFDTQCADVAEFY